MVNGRHRPQGSFDEAPLENKELAQLLSDREEAKVDLQPFRLKYKGLNDQVRGIIEGLSLEDGTYRCGRFVVTISESEEKEISFERAASHRISIKLAKT